MPPVQEPPSSPSPEPAPARHVVTIIGSTGTGKSQLAVELAQALQQQDDARRFGVYSGRGAEAISADSMQMYRGLDVITNKATREEMQGVKHHLMDFLEPGEQCTVGEFVREAGALIENCHEQHKLPIVVGGTTYYVQHLLFPGRLVSLQRGGGGGGDEAPQRWSDDEDAPPALSASAAASLREQLSVLSAEQQTAWASLAASRPGKLPDDVSDATLWGLLDTLDPAMARRWHWRDTRKVGRSLRVLLETGRRHSEWIESQQRQERSSSSRRAEAAARTGDGGATTKHLVLWLWCEPETLQKRLAARVEKMVERGLLAEIQSLRSKGADVDYTRGIYQAIGYKEFASFLAHCDSGSASDAEGQHLFAHALERMQIGTRQYAKYQTKWIRNTLAPEVAEADDVEFYLLDATDLSKWDSNVGGPALDLVAKFLTSAPLPSASSLSFAASSQLPQAPRSLADPLGRNAMEACALCTTDAATPVLVRRADMAAHVQTRAHRLASRSTQRTAPDPEVVARKREERRRLREGLMSAKEDDTQ